MGCDLGNVDVGQDNAGVVASHLEGDTLRGLGCGGHDLFAGCDAAGEADLVDVWVVDELGAEIILATESLNQAGWEDLLSDLNHLKGGVGGEGRWLDDDGVSHLNCREDFAERQEEWEVPRADCCGNTDGNVLVDYGLLVIIVLGDPRGSKRSPFAGTKFSLVSRWLLEVDVP